MRSLALGPDRVMLGAGEPTGSPVGNTGQRADVVSAGHLCARDRDRELSAGGQVAEELPHSPGTFGKGQDYTGKGPWLSPSPKIWPRVHSPRTLS